MAYADYDYYKDTYGGTLISEGDFVRLSRLASDYIDTVTFGHAAEATKKTVVEKLKDACCALAEEQQNQDQGGEVASANNDGYSETYVTSGKTPERRRYQIAVSILGPTGLLYGGVRPC